MLSLCLPDAFATNKKRSLQMLRWSESYPQLLCDALQSSNCCHEGYHKAEDAQSLAQEPLPRVQRCLCAGQLNLDWKIHLQITKGLKPAKSLSVLFITAH